LSPADTHTTPAEAQFLGLRQRFVSGLTNRQSEIEGATEHAALQMALHRLSGAAGSYGFEDLGHCARRAEALAEAGPSAGLVEAIATLMAEIGRLRAA
jgi:HPt (histidine-containing phosphotransfer) domain-containing protein